MKAENEEFKALITAAGWTPAEAARRLDLGRSSTSRFLSGEITPSPPVMKLLKLMLAAEQPGALAAPEPVAASWERELVEDLRRLRPEDRARVLNAVRAMVAGLPRHAPGVPAARTGGKAGAASSAAAHGAARLLKKVSAELSKRVLDRSPK